MPEIVTVLPPLMLAGAVIATAVQEPTVKDGPGSASSEGSPPGATSTQVGGLGGPPTIPSYVRTKLFVSRSPSFAMLVGTSMTAVPSPVVLGLGSGSIEPVVVPSGVNVLGNV